VSIYVHLRAKHVSLQVVLKPSNDQAHADRNGEQRKSHRDATGNKFVLKRMHSLKCTTHITGFAQLAIPRVLKFSMSMMWIWQ
jgi:hypothetical protein